VTRRRMLFDVNPLNARGSLEEAKEKRQGTEGEGLAGRLVLSADA